MGQALPARCNGHPEGVPGARAATTTTTSSRPWSSLITSSPRLSSSSIISLTRVESPTSISWTMYSWGTSLSTLRNPSACQPPSLPSPSKNPISGTEMSSMQITHSVDGIVGYILKPKERVMAGISGQVYRLLKPAVCCVRVAGAKAVAHWVPW